MSRCFIVFAIVLFMQLNVSAQDADSVRVREIRSGVYTHLESVSEKLLAQNDGYSLELGAYQERKLLRQVYFSYSGGVQFRSYNDTGINLDTTPNTDTSIIVQFYDSFHEEFKLSTSANVRFVYISNPKIYMTIGVRPEFTLKQTLVNTFNKTRFVNDEFITIDESRDNPVPAGEDDFRLKGINLAFEIGLGIELNKFNIEIVNRSNNVQAVGLRIKYRFNTLTY